VPQDRSGKPEGDSGARKAPMISTIVWGKLRRDAEKSCSLASAEDETTAGLCRMCRATNNPRVAGCRVLHCWADPPLRLHAHPTHMKARGGKVNEELGSCRRIVRDPMQGKGYQQFAPHLPRHGPQVNGCSRARGLSKRSRTTVPAWVSRARCFSASRTRSACGLVVAGPSLTRSNRCRRQNRRHRTSTRKCSWRASSTSCWDSSRWRSGQTARYPNGKSP
jgi:hypothetical protein